MQYIILIWNVVRGKLSLNGWLWSCEDRVWDGCVHPCSVDKSMQLQGYTSKYKNYFNYWIIAYISKQANLLVMGIVKYRGHLWLISSIKWRRIFNLNWYLTNFLQITSLQIYKEKMLLDSFLFLYVLMFILYLCFLKTIGS